MNRNIRQIVFPLSAALIWGAAFAFQSMSTDLLGPFTFTAARSAIAVPSLLLVLLLLHALGGKKDEEKPRNKKMLFLGGACCGACLAFSSTLQQLALADATTGKAAFITALYVVIVPLTGLFFGRRLPKRLLLAVLFAVAGLYCLCVKDGFSFSKTDLVLLLCAFGFSAHILSVDYFTRFCDGVELSCVQFAAEAVFCGIGALLLETPSLSAIFSCLGALLYVGVLSSAVAFTLQILAQKDANPTVVSLLLSLESLFGAIAGVILLHESMSGREILGGAFMLLAVVLAQLPEREKR